MDFSDFSEFIGPLIFGVIAWLSNYFSKKKKPKQTSPDTVKNKDYDKRKFEQIIQETFNPGREEEKLIEEVEIIEKKENKLTDSIEINREEAVVPNLKAHPKNKKEKNYKNESSLSKLKEKLKNNSSLKEAVILKEILDRKY